MKYFTQAWRDAEGDPDFAVFQQYDRYLATVRHRLPADLLKLWEEYTLHDARVVAVDADTPRKRLALTLDGWDQPLDHPLRYALTFTDVSSGAGLPDDVAMTALEDLGHFEMEVLDEGIEFRMLFTSGIEWTIRCGDVAVEVKARTR